MKATKKNAQKSYQGLASKNRPERRVNLSMFMKNGHLVSVGGQFAVPYVTLGRTASKLGIGFEIEDAQGNLVADFVLDRNQVAALRRFLGYSLSRMKAPSLPSSLVTSIGKATKTTYGKRWDGALLSPKQVKRQWKSGQIVYRPVFTVVAS